MAHDHSHSHNVPKRKLIGAILFNTVITVAEFIGGIMSGYLALLADAVHNLSDVAALILAYIGEIGAARPSTKRSTFGFKRLEVMTAMISAVSLIAIAVYIFYEAYERFLTPQEIGNPVLLLTVAGIGLVGNLLTVYILHSSRESSLNFKTAFLHMLYDSLSSAAVIIGAIVIIKTGWSYLDPILSILIGLMILWSSFKVIKEATMIFMEAVPSKIDFDRVARTIEEHPKICEMHHLHIWSLSSNSIALSCHISLNETDYSEAPKIIGELGILMKEKFAIDHCTIQPEMELCADEINSHDHSSEEHRDDNAPG